MHGKYDPTVRSIHVQKIKKFIINDFKIIDYTTPPSGKEHGAVIWICKAPNGRFFNVKPLGTLYERKKLYFPKTLMISIFEIIYKIIN